MQTPQYFSRLVLGTVLGLVLSVLWFQYPGELNDVSKKGEVVTPPASGDACFPTQSACENACQAPGCTSDGDCVGKRPVMLCLGSGNTQICTPIGGLGGVVACGSGCDACSCISGACANTFDPSDPMCGGTTTPPTTPNPTTPNPTTTNPTTTDPTTTNPTTADPTTTNPTTTNPPSSSSSARSISSSSSSSTPTCANPLPDTQCVCGARTATCADGFIDVCLGAGAVSPTSWYCVPPSDAGLDICCGAGSSASTNSSSSVSVASSSLSSSSVPSSTSSRSSSATSSVPSSSSRSSVASSSSRSSSTTSSVPSSSSRSSVASSSSRSSSATSSITSSSSSRSSSATSSVPSSSSRSSVASSSSSSQFSSTTSSVTSSSSSSLSSVSSSIATCASQGQSCAGGTGLQCCTNLICGTGLTCQVPSSSSSTTSSIVSSSRSSSSSRFSAFSSSVITFIPPTVQIPPPYIPPTTIPPSSRPPQNMYCGDGIVQVQYGEQCDFGSKNGAEGSNCAVTCQVIAQAKCGDESIDANEECDDGNVRDFDGCSAQCRRETGECGDGQVQRGFGEQCDLGTRNGLPGASCDASCKKVVPPRCGDGMINDPNEQCDLGSKNSNTQGSLCLKNCLLPSCGDGIRQNGEQCDDGNLFAFDGCDATCQVEMTVLAPQDEPEPTPEAPIASIFPTRPVQTRPLPKNIPTPAKTPTGPELFLVILVTGGLAGASIFRRRLF